MLVISLWIPLKNLLKKQKEFKEKSLKLTRFSRNYTLFKNTLLSTEKKNFESTNPLTLGNKEAKLHIAVVTSPYCGHCKEAHEILYKIAIKHPENVKVSIFYNTPIGKEEDRNQLFRSLVSIYQTEGQECYSQAVKELYETKDYNKYKELKIENPDKIDEIINGQAHSCFENKIHFTPAIFINGYEYPKMYERKELAFFIPDLIDDEF